MGRPSKLTDAQWSDIQRRLLAGETARSLARQYGLSEAAIRKKYGAHQNISTQSAQVRSTAEKLADAQTALQALTPAQRPVAIDLADKLRSISTNYASAADLSTKTALRMLYLANQEAGKIDDANLDKEQALTALMSVGRLTKLGNDALVPASNLLAANKERMLPVAPADDASDRGGVLVVPGVIQDPKAWTKLVKGE